MDVSIHFIGLYVMDVSNYFIGLCVNSCNVMNWRYKYKSWHDAAYNVEWKTKLQLLVSWVQIHSYYELGVSE